MSIRPLLALLTIAAFTLAGCGGTTGGTPATDSSGRQQLAEGKGAISGLVIDDVFRPVPQALVLLQGVGLTATTDNAGQFTFLDLEPGAYIALVQSDGHQAKATNIDVTAGAYKEVEIRADRVVNSGSQILTEEYAVFIPCAFAAPVAGWVTFNCVLDLSGDSFRSSTDPLNYTAIQNATYLVAEAKMNTVGNYNFVLRPPGSDTDPNVPTWGQDIVQNTDYARVQLKRGETDTAQGANQVWKNDVPMQAALFVSGQVPDPTDASGPGLGANVAIKATILISVFDGKPSVNVDDYHLLK